MELTISQFAGFCGGVRRAYDMVMGLDMKNIKKPVFVLGDLVHNKEVVEKIKEKGIGIIDLEKFKKLSKGEIGTLIITAHGDGPQIFEEAKTKGIDIIDTTCPNVIKVQRLARVFFKRSEQVILIGDKEHKEVKGIFNWGGKLPLIVSNLQEAQAIDLDKGKKVHIISQTTQDEKKVREISEFLKNKFLEVDIDFVDTICSATQERQREIKEKSGLFDAVVVIGDTHSANSRRLFEIAKEVNPKSFFVQKSNQLKKEDLDSFQKILVTAGASTPDWLIEKIKKEIESWYS